MPYRRAGYAADFAVVVLLSIVAGCGFFGESPDSIALDATDGVASVTPSEVRLREIHREPPDVPAVNPFQQALKSPVVLLFARHDCPISNRYAPEFGRILARFQPAGVRFWVVYPDPGLEIQEIRSHLRDYDYHCDALWDPEQHLTKLVGAAVTPEVAVYDHAHQLVYRGRIDDRFVDFGKSRPEPSQRDLHQALESVLSGSVGRLRTTTAIGCPIADLKR